MKKIDRKILLNPGPATTTDTVKMAQVVSDICPREKEFTHLMNGIRNDLLKIINADHQNYKTILFGGSGTAAMESVITSVIPNNQKLLIIINGAYGERMKKIAEIFSVPFISLGFKWGTRINFADVEKQLKLNPEITCIAMVHHETTTGILNCIKSFSKLGSKNNYTLILDAISSYAGIPIDIDKTPIDFIMSTSNKCIQGIAGLSFVIGNKVKLDELKNYKSRSFYLNLFDQYQYLEKSKQMRFTPPVQVMYSLKQAIDEYFLEGGLNRYIRYKENWQVLRNGLLNLGFNLLLDIEDESKILLTVLEPDHNNFDFNKLHDLLYQRGFTIYPGKIMEEQSFRLSIMGYLSKNDIKLFLLSLNEVLDEMDVIL